MIRQNQLNVEFLCIETFSLAGATQNPATFRDTYKVLSPSNQVEKSAIEGYSACRPERR